MKKNECNTVEEYLQQHNEIARKRLEQIRKIILENIPGAVESISYQMPAYKTFGKPLVYFAAFQNHIGFYATPTGHEAFKEELSNYKQGKGSVQFPFSQDLPLDLIKRIVLFRAEENSLKYGRS